jgi:hypothetical protein
VSGVVQRMSQVVVEVSYFYQNETLQFGYSSKLVIELELSSFCCDTFPGRF